MSFALADEDGSPADVIQHETNRNRKTAMIVGVLYIIGTVAGVFSLLITQPVLKTPDYLAQISANENPIILGSLLVLTMGLALALVPVLLFPILKKHNEALALGYVVFRGALETVCYLAMAICRFFLIQVSRETAAAGASHAAYLQSLGAVFLKGSDSIASIVVIVFSLDALMLYFLLYRSQLVPRWISVWGFIAILLHFSTAFLMMFRILDPDTVTIINLPIFVQEMVMATWLIVKGFNPTALTSAQPVQREVL
jgi:hypothetical protein